MAYSLVALVGVGKCSSADQPHGRSWQSPEPYRTLLQRADMLKEEVQSWMREQHLKWEYRIVLSSL
jgi:hypothetical protein